MTAERPSGPDQGTRLAESLLGSEKVLSGLLAGDKRKRPILQVMVSKLMDDPLGQRGFIETIFSELAGEGDFRDIRRRNAALAILVDDEGDNISLPKDIRPIVEANPTVVCVAYQRAVARQTKLNNPFSGSIYRLLKVGQAIASYLGKDAQKGQEIVDGWEQLAGQFPGIDVRNYIRAEVQKIKDGMFPHAQLDFRVEQLRKEGLTNLQIAERLARTLPVIAASASRLIAQGRIERRDNVSAAKLLQILQEFKAAYPVGALSLKEMGKKLGEALGKGPRTRERARQIYDKLKAAHDDLPPTRGVGVEKLPSEYRERLSREVSARINQGMDKKQIADELHVPATWVEKLSPPKMI